MKELVFVVLVISFLLPASKSYSQSSALDTKKGFKDFTLGDAYSKWSSSLKYTNTADDNIKYYNYIGSCCQQIFQYNLVKIRLGFKDDKLQVIYLVTENARDQNWMSSQYKSLKSSLSSLYGTPSELKAEGGGLTSVWSGNTVILSLDYVYDGVQQEGSDFYTGSHCTVLVGFITNSNGF